MEKDTRRLEEGSGVRWGSVWRVRWGGATYDSSPNWRVRTTSSWPGVSWSYGLFSVGSMTEELDRLTSKELLSR